MTLATMTLEVSGLRTVPGPRGKDEAARKVQVELRPQQSTTDAAPPPAPMAMMVHQMIEVDKASQPELGSLVRVSYEVVR